MAEYKTTDQSNLAWVQTWNMGVKAPAIAKRIFETYADALAFANDVSANGTCIPGLTLAVFGETTENKDMNGVYFVEKVATSADSNDAVLVKLGASSSVSDLQNALMISGDDVD